MNRQIKRLGIFLVICYLALFVKLNQVQVFQAEQYNENPLNARKAQQEYDRARGRIISADGQILAESRTQPDGSQFRRERVYPQGILFSQVTGYFSFRFGSAGVERYYNDVLTGQTLRQQIEGFTNLLEPKENTGNVRLTMRADVQQVARDALGDREGSVVAVDPRNGDILAFWSNPYYDPNPISSNSDAAEGTAVLLNLDPRKPLLGHAYQEIYFPGSTFKVVTAGTGVQSGVVNDSQPVYPVRTQYKPPKGGQPISNFGGEACGGALPQIMAQSCNTAFAEMGAETIGPERMVQGSQSFGFNQAPPIDLPEPAESVFPTDVRRGEGDLAQASIGQNDVSASALEMALVASGVANGGRISTPHVMKEIFDSDNKVINTYGPTQWLNPLNAEAAATIRRDMVGVVANGTATGLQIPGQEVGGKTGTAQLGDGTGRVHTWIIGFAGPPGGEPTVAVSVVVLNQFATNDTTGGRIAAPVANTVLKKILQTQSLPPSPAGAPAGGGSTTLQPR